MTSYMLLMNNDFPADHPSATDAGWEDYIQKLRSQNCFIGGSGLGAGARARKSTTPAASSSSIEVKQLNSQNNTITGYILVKADSLEHAMQLLPGNPVYEAGGSVQIQALVVD